MAAENECMKAHAIMISVPYQGHINPFVNLALKLASRGFSVTFVHLEFVHHKLSKSHSKNPNEFDFFSEARESGLDIHYTTISDGFAIDFDRELNFKEYWESMLRDFPAIVDEFVGKIIRLSDQCSVDTHFLVSDTNYWWSSIVAKKHNLVNVSFWTGPALVFALIYHSRLLAENGHFPCKDNMVDDIDYVPGVGKISTRDLMPFMKESDDQSQSVITRILSVAFEQVKKADFILHNTVQELESETISALRKYQPNYAIGPVNFSKNLPTSATVSKSLLPESDCASWLESKPTGSVLYVSFGSFVRISKQVIEEVAYGILLSEVNFIWVIRPGCIVGSSDNNDVLPFGFEDEIRIKDRGLIIPWCDQIKVLSNRAVGGFLTHNGWNSTLESMWCGVPMICYPIDFDQVTNRKLVVGDWKIGINLCDNYGIKSFLDRKEVAEKIKSLMSGTISERLWQQVDNVKKMLRNAVEIDGSSERNFVRFIDDLRAKIIRTASNVTRQ